MTITSLSIFCSDQVVQVQGRVKKWRDLHSCDGYGLTVFSLYEIGRGRALSDEIKSLLVGSFMNLNDGDECLLVQGVGTAGGSQKNRAQILDTDVRLIIEVLGEFQVSDDGWNLAFVVESDSLPDRLRSWCDAHYPSVVIYAARPRATSSKKVTELGDSLFAVEPRSNPFAAIQESQSISTKAMLERVRGYIQVGRDDLAEAPALLGSGKQLEEARSRSPGRWVAIFRNLADMELQRRFALDEKATVQEDPVVALAKISFHYTPNSKYGGNTMNIDKNHIGSTMAKALEQAWLEVRKDHPQLPETIFVLGRATSAKFSSRVAEYGDSKANAWILYDRGADQGVIQQEMSLYEVFVGGEALSQNVEQVFALMLREAAIMLGGMSDVSLLSRQNRYHNRDFVDYASKVGLAARLSDSGDGYSDISLTDEAKLRYQDALTLLEVELVAYRVPEEIATPRVPNPNANPDTGHNFNRAQWGVCDCEVSRVVIAPNKLLVDGKVKCSDCDRPFRLRTTPPGEGAWFNEEQGEFEKAQFIDRRRGCRKPTTKSRRVRMESK